MKCYSKILSIFLLLCLICFNLIFTNPVSAQSVAVAEKILTVDAFLDIVRQFHPVVKQANIQVEKAEAGITISRAGFDPVLSLNSDQKTFDGKNYYSYTNPDLKIPTWYGIEVKAGLENNGGVLLNNETTAGQSGYIGISIPLAKNLLMDKRRAALQQAKLFKSQSEVERQMVVNDLLYDAADAYWNWVRVYHVNQIIKEAVQLNENRFDLIKIAFRQGDKPAIDTIEALAQLQNFKYLLSDNQVSLQNAAIELSNFLWLPNNSFYQLSNEIVPEKKWNETELPELTITDLQGLLASVKFTHPKLRQYTFKLGMLELDKKLKFQDLLPVVNVRANVLTKGYDLLNGFGKSGYFENYNKFGISMGLPLRLSEGRGAYKTAKLKIQETQLDFNIRQQEVENKLRFYFNEMLGLHNQVKLYAAAYQNYQTLFRGESTRFSAGESSLFLLNSRENKVLEARQKLIELKTKFYKTTIAVQWAAGLLK